MAILTFMLGSSVDYDVSLPPVSVLLALALRLLIHAHTALVFDVDAVGAADFALLRESESQLSMPLLKAVNMKGTLLLELKLLPPHVWADDLLKQLLPPRFAGNGQSGPPRSIGSGGRSGEEGSKLC
eukprot:s3098_g7.t1